MKKQNKIKRIAVITSGGDAPGMNTVLRAVVRGAIYNGLEVYGIKRGYIGLLNNDLIPLTSRSVSGIINHGGTILKTGRCPEIRTAKGLAKAVRILKSNGIDALVGIGGDGSMRAAERISRHGIPAVSIPASIDNDVYGTDETVGFDTAIDTAIEAVDKIRDTAASHDRIFVVAVMGRAHGFLALSVGIAAGAEFVLVPEIRYDINTISAEVNTQIRKGKTSIIIIFAEGVGDPFAFARTLQKKVHMEVRVSSLGYIQRGGSPSARSRILASLFGTRAIDILLAGKSNRLIAWRAGVVTDVSYDEVKGKEKKLNTEEYNLIKRLAI